MIFAFVEDGTLHVYETAQEAIREYEGIDVESGVVRFYDESGVYLEPRFIHPNQSGKVLGIIKWVESGAYDLVANPAAQEDSFALALYETRVLDPNPWFTSLGELKSVLAAKGVEVEWRGGRAAPE
ncbi:MAG TPA: hypothetical protein VNM87_02795 [Candidatus Udaeobacter sp.]|nr:hypothetical protein [Candidatus Udaeobacter sp.]